MLNISGARRKTIRVANCLPSLKNIISIQMIQNKLEGMEINTS